MNLRFSLLLIFCVLLMSSCDKTRVFDAYKTVGTAWHKDSVVSFDLPEIDSIKTYNLFVNVRNNDAYEFNNLFLIVSLEHPKGRVFVDTLEYKMTDAEGRLLGQGFADIKENKLFYKENMRFKPAGKYTVNIKQAVRQNGKVSGVEQLNGITEVGFRVESIQ